MIHYVLDGKGVFQMDGRQWELKKDDAFVILPDVETSYHADAEEPWKYLWVGFYGLSAGECISNMGFSRECPSASGTCGAALQKLIRQILDAHELTLGNELLRTALLMEFIAVLLKDRMAQRLQSSGTKPAKDYSSEMYVWYAIDYMKEHYREKIRISSLADYIGITRGYLTSSFQKAIGMSPQEYLLQLRMDRAASLLKDTDLPVSSIAGQVGYEDSLAFSRRFHQRFGMSPTQYRTVRPELVRGKDKQDYMPKLPL